MASWWSSEDVDLDEDSIVSRVIQAVGLFGDILTLEDTMEPFLSDMERRDGAEDEGTGGREEEEKAKDIEEQQVQNVHDNGGKESEEEGLQRGENLKEVEKESKHKESGEEEEEETKKVLPEDTEGEKEGSVAKEEPGGCMQTDIKTEKQEEEEGCEPEKEEEIEVEENVEMQEQVKEKATIDEGQEGVQTQRERIEEEEEEGVRRIEEEDRHDEEEEDREHNKEKYMVETEMRKGVKKEKEEEDEKSEVEEYEGGAEDEQEENGREDETVEKEKSPDEERGAIGEGKEKGGVNEEQEEKQVNEKGTKELAEIKQDQQVVGKKAEVDKTVVREVENEEQMIDVKEERVEIVGMNERQDKVVIKDGEEEKEVERQHAEEEIDGEEERKPVAVREEEVEALVNREENAEEEPPEEAESQECSPPSPPQTSADSLRADGAETGGGAQRDDSDAAKNHNGDVSPASVSRDKEEQGADITVPPLHATLNLRYLTDEEIQSLEERFITLSVTSLPAPGDLVEVAEEAGIEDTWEIIPDLHTDLQALGYSWTTSMEAGGPESSELNPAPSSSSSGDTVMEVKEENGDKDEGGTNTYKQNSEADGADDKKNGSSQPSKYKTVSYRRIRRGNTRQRIDEFEARMDS